MAAHIIVDNGYLKIIDVVTVQLSNIIPFHS